MNELQGWTLEGKKSKKKKKKSFLKKKKTTWKHYISVAINWSSRIIQFGCKFCFINCGMSLNNCLPSQATVHL